MASPQIQKTPGELVLLVDDNPTNLQVLHQTLDGRGYDLRVARNGEDALALARKVKPSLILLDVLMPPGIDGYEVCRRLKADTDTRRIAVIFLSGLEGAEDKVRGFEAGAVDFVTKPFQADEVIARVETHLTIQRLQRELSQANEALTSMNEDLERKVSQRSAALLRSRDAVIFGLAKLAESRDEDTGLHLERICRFVEILAGELAKTDPSVDEEYIETISRTAALHDIGKVGIPDGVLLKRGQLSPEERQVMERHPCIGGDTLMGIKQRWGDDPFLVTAAQIALGHHEQWDGSGYPYGLKSEGIALSARIIALADVYDALTSKRVYKEALSHEEARAMIVEKSGTHFDPRVVEAFLGVEAEFRRVAAELRS
ncbi:MAG: response regulator [Phycisphaerae bacterium]|nr:response regulator [Phycisphaerae bacterium]